MNRHNYMELLKGQIRCKRAIPMIEEEVEGHIDEQKLDFMAEGMSEKEAEEAAVREMGDPVEVGVQLDRIHRPKMEYRLLGFVIGLSVLGLSMQIFVMRLTQLCNTTGVAVELSNDYFFRHTLLWMALGAVIMMGICFLDYTLLGKHILWIWAAVILAMAGHRMFFAVRVNGMYRQGNFFICLLVPVFAGIVYHYRGKGKRGLWKSFAFLTVTAGIIITITGSSLYWILFCMIGGILILTAVLRGWYGVNKKLLLAEVTGILAGIIALLAAGMKISNGYVLSDYQKARLAVYVSSSEEIDAYRTYIDTMLTGAAEGVKSGTMSEKVTENSDVWLGSVRSDFMWLFAAKMLKSWQMALLIGVVVLFGLWIFVLVRRQKNYLGYIVELSCALMILMESLIYIAYNFGYFPVSSVYMPFITYGGANTLVTYIYMGLFLSVSRNQNIVPIR